MAARLVAPRAVATTMSVLLLVVRGPQQLCHRDPQRLRELADGPAVGGLPVLQLADRGRVQAGQRGHLALRQQRPPPRLRQPRKPDRHHAAPPVHVPGCSPAIIAWYILVML